MDNLPFLHRIEVDALPDFTTVFEYLPESKYLMSKRITAGERVRRIEHSTFEFSKLPYAVYQRFIELLAVDTAHFFKKTSKRNFYNTARVRGIECGELVIMDDFFNDGALEKCAGKPRIFATNARTGWIPFYNGHDSLQAIISERIDPALLMFERCYTKLNFFADLKNPSEIMFFANILIHPKLEEVGICFNIERFNTRTFAAIQTQFLHIFALLDLCPNLKCVQIAFSGLLGVLLLHQLKKIVELFYSKHKETLKSCDLLIGFRFTIYQNVLKLVLPSKDGKHVLVDIPEHLFAEYQHV